MPRDNRLFMTFPNSFWRHMKIRPLSDNAFRTFVEMNGYSREENLDGRIPVAFARSQWRKKSLDELMRNHPTRPTLSIQSDDTEGDVYVLWNYAEHQQTAADIAATSQTNSRNGAKGGRPRKKRTETESVTGSLANGNQSQESRVKSQEIDLTDVTDLPESSHLGDRASSRTDLSEEVVSEAKRAGLNDLGAVLDLLEPITGELNPRHGIEIAQIILRRARTPVLQPTAYIARACEKREEIRHIAIEILDIPGVA
jgi:hypothetical protein